MPYANPARPTLTLALAVAIVALVRPGAARDEAEAVQAAGGDAGSGARAVSHRDTVDAATCARAAYLCPGLGGRDPARVMRWPDGTAELRVLVPRPPLDDEALATAMQQAAVRGVRAWQGQPFPLRIETERRGGPPDIVVSWTSTLEGHDVGRVRVRWSPGPGEILFVVDEFVLAMRDPWQSDLLLPLSALELAAAHEMGHALGLPHSSNENDLMYRTNTAGHLSVDDFRAVEALYRLPNGAYLTPMPR